MVKQILQQKNIPNEIEEEIVKYLPLPEQEKKKKEMIRKINIWYNNDWRISREALELLEDPMLLTTAATYRGTACCWIRHWHRNFSIDRRAREERAAHNWFSTMGAERRLRVIEVVKGRGDRKTQF